MKSYTDAEIKKYILDRIIIDALGCWRWQAGKSNEGYPTGMGEKGRAHRQAYEAWRGPIPPGMYMDHRCRVKDCVNPQHLEPATHSQNVKFAVWAKNRQMSKNDLKRAALIHKMVGQR